MSHIIIIGEAIESLENKAASPMTEAEANLKQAFENADTYAHSENADAELVEAIEELAGYIKGWLDVQTPPLSGVRCQSYANQMNAIYA